MTDSGRTAPLAGLLVLDLGQVYAGPYCAWLLGQLGARVIKVESPTGDIVRARTADPRGPYSYLMLNSDKESIVLDLKSDDGREALLTLVEHADVLVENFTVGTLDRLGLGEDVLSARNPRLIIASGTAFGLDGPYSGLSAMDVTVQALSGIISATGFPDGPPVKTAAAVADFSGALHLCVGVLAALFERERSGVGQRVESSMHEAAIMTMCSAISSFMDGTSGADQRTGNRHPALSVAPYNVYECRDGYVAINCPSQSHWIALVGAMEVPDLLREERFATPVRRAENIDDVDIVVGGWAAGFARDELIGLLTLAGVPCAPVLSVPEMLADQHLIARGAMVTVEDPGRGTMVIPRSPIRLHGSPGRHAPTPAPNLGEHTTTVLQEFLTNPASVGPIQA